VKTIRIFITTIALVVALFSQTQAIDLPFGLKFGMTREQVRNTLSVDSLSVVQAGLWQESQEFHQLKEYSVSSMNKNYKGLKVGRIRLNLCDKWGLVNVSFLFSLGEERDTGLYNFDNFNNLTSELMDKLGQPKNYSCEYVWRCGDTKISLTKAKCSFRTLQYFHKNRFNAAHDDSLYFARNSPDAYEGSLFLTDLYGRPSKEIYVKIFFWERGGGHQMVQQIYLKLINTSRDDYANLIAYAPMVEFSKYADNKYPIALLLPYELKKKKLTYGGDGIVAPGDTAETLFHFGLDLGFCIPNDCHPLEEKHSINNILKGEARLVITLDKVSYSFDNLHKISKK